MNKYILLLLIVILCNSVSAQPRKRRPIPSPVITSTNLTELSPGMLLTVFGHGFIKGFPSAHQIYLINGRKRIKVQALTSTATELQFVVPQDTSLGDYDLEVKIQTRLLYSEKASSSQSLHIRPKAPLAPKLNYQAINASHELEQMFSEKTFQGQDLYYEFIDDLKLGLNELRTYYVKDGYESVRSEPVSFYYLPALDVEDQLQVESETPLKSFAIAKFNMTNNGTRMNYDVSTITNKDAHDLLKSFYLRTPTQARYLERTIKLKPIFVEAIHVLEPESATLRNRSAVDQSLTKCSLADSLKEYHKFTAEIIPARSSLTINKNLGLNNTTADSLIFSCNGEVMDQFDYEKLDAAGMGIRL